MAEITGTFSIDGNWVKMTVEVGGFYGRSQKDAVAKVGAVIEGVRAGTEKKASKK